MASFKVTFTRIDNQAIIYVNGVEIWDSGVITDNPLLNKEVEIKDNLIPGVNQIRIDGINFGPWKSANPFTFDYTLFADEVAISHVYQTSNIEQLSTAGSTVVASSLIQVIQD
ncbi:MAG: hypothetical protein AAF587_22590 [Bacteroidota bacterium]